MAEDFYCEICRRSDSRGKKHVYTQKHKERTKTVLRKFEEKMVHATNCISKGPTITRCEPSDHNDKFWCPFCSVEVNKHKRDGQVTARFKNWAEHLCSINHHKNVHNFFWKNKLDMKKRDKYKLSQGKLDEFKSVFETAVQRFNEEIQEAVNEEANRIRTLEMKRPVVQEQFKVKTEEVVDRGGRNSPISSPETAPNSSNVDCDSVHLNTAAILENGKTATQGPVTTDQGVQGVNPPLQSPVGVIQRNTYEHSVHPPSVNQRYPPEPSWHPSNQTQAGTHGGNRHVSSSSSVSSFSDGPWYPGPGPSGSTMERDPLMLPFIHPPGPSSSSAASSGKRRTTVVTSSGGLTVISRKKTGLKGNIHTGAVPPWMMDDEDEEEDDDGGSGQEHRVGSTLLIGPTEDDFKKHLESERKRKLNPNRVGANFDHLAETSDDWLPSFGRVWNHGPRWRSRKHYRKEAGSKVKKLKK